MRWSRRLIKQIAIFGGKKWLINDGFTIALTATNVDGTDAYPGPGTRSTGATGSISGGAYVLTGAADDSLWYDETVTRAVGRILIATPTITDATKIIEFGFDANQAGALGANSLLYNTDLLKPTDGGAGGPAIFVPADATQYTLAMALRAAGAYFFVDGELLYVYGTNATTPLYAGISNTDAAGTIDYVRVSTGKYVPVPIAADTGTVADVDGTYYTDGGTLTGIEAGGDGRAWTGDTWTNGVGGAYNTPTLGAELVANGDMELDSDWSNYGSPATNERSDIRSHGGTYSRHIVTTGITQGCTQSVTGTVARWLRFLAWTYVVTGDARLVNATSETFPKISLDIYDTGEWVGSTWTCRATVSSIGIYLRPSSVAISEVYFDDVSLMELSTADLFRSITDAATPYVYASANWIVTAGTQAGIVTNLDSAATPANFIIVYHDGTSVVTEKCVAGTYTTIATVAAAYSANAPLVVRTRLSGSDLSVWVWYNNVYIGNYTVTDAGIISNTLHGLFSTHADNVCSDVNIYPTGGHNIPGWTEPAAQDPVFLMEDGTQFLMEDGAQFWMEG